MLKVCININVKFDVRWKVLAGVLAYSTENLSCVIFFSSSLPRVKTLERRIKLLISCVSNFPKTNSKFMSAAEENANPLAVCIMLCYSVFQIVFCNYKNLFWPSRSTSLLFYNWKLGCEHSDNSIKGDRRREFLYGSCDFFLHFRWMGKLFGWYVEKKAINVNIIIET